MKKSLIVLLSVISIGAQAQTNMNDTIFNLSEVTVKGRSIVQKVDRMLIIPTRDARKNLLVFMVVRLLFLNES
ncbi:MAG: hypothetical protein IKI06_09435 [Prevotella sp.]|nr:hypothetical protein [Prevotella sp.]